MSVQAITWAIGQDISSASQKLVLICLANYADADGVCFPGQKTLAADASMTERSVRTALLGLEALGLVSRARRQRQDGTRTSDEYRLVINRKDFPQASAPTGKNTSDLPEKTRQTYRKDFPGNEPVREPSENQERARGKSDIPTDAECDLFWQAYPEGGRVSFARADLPLMLAPHCARLGVPAVIGAAKAYAEAVKRADTKPVSLRNFLLTPALVEQYAKASKPAGPNIAAEVAFFAKWQDRNRWRDIVGGPCPGEPGCRAPPGVLAEHGFGEKQRA